MENRLLSVSASGLTESYLYNESGIRVKKVSNGAPMLYPFAHYEVENGVVVKYYFFNGQRVAMQRGSGALTYLHSDHLGSTVLSTLSSGVADVAQGYHGYGKYRLGSVLPTDHRFTAPRGPPKLDGTGLMYYGARYYAHAVGAKRHRRGPSGRGTFISPDTLVPDPINVWDYNRFAYARLNPMRFTDPSGYYSNDEIMQHFGHRPQRELPLRRCRGRGHWARVKKVSGGATTYSPFPHYEVSGSTVTKYYFFADQRVAMRRGSTLTYLHPDRGPWSTPRGACRGGLFEFGDVTQTVGVVKLNPDGCACPLLAAREERLAKRVARWRWRAVELASSRADGEETVGS